LFSALLIVAAGQLLPAVSLAEDGYYKWTDNRGRPQHSDRPPPSGIEYEFISTDTGMKRRVSAEESRTSANDGSMAPSMPAPARDGGALEQEVVVDKDPALCDQARGNLDSLNSAARVRIRDNDGTIRYLTEEEKNVQRQKALDLITVHCNS